MRIRYTKLTLALIPAGLFASSLFLASHHGSYFLRNNFDPDYSYLLNSLSLLKFRTPGHTDHPGTTLQLLGAVVVWFQWVATWLFGHRQPLTDSVLSHTERYLRGINIVLNLLIGGTLYWSAWSIYRLSNSLIAALILQLSVLVYSQAFLALPRVSPEPLLIATGLAFMALLAPMVLRRDGGMNENSLASAAGAMFGFGLITKVTFAPWLAVILLFPKISQKRRFMIAAVVASMVFLLPVTARLPDMASWFTSLLTHSGHYGAGPVGMPGTSVLAANLVSLWQVEPPLFWFLGLYIVLLFLLPHMRQRGLPLPDTTRPLLLAACTAIIAELILVVKHPAYHYLLPVLVLTAFVNSGLWVLLGGLLPRTSLMKVEQLCRVAILALIGFGFVHNWSTFRWWMDAARTDRQNIAELHAVEQRLPECQVMGSYRSSLETYALAFASGTSAGVHANALEKLHPGAINYDPFTDRFWSFASVEKSEDLKRVLSTGQCVLLESSPLDAKIMNRSSEGIHFAKIAIAENPIIASDATILYRLQALP